jgi:hypothetical protein
MLATPLADRLTPMAPERPLMAMLPWLVSRPDLDHCPRSRLPYIPDGPPVDCGHESIRYESS